MPLRLGTRQLVERTDPVVGGKKNPDYPWYIFRDKKIIFQAEFPPGVPQYPVTIREMGLFDSNWMDPHSKLFSIVRTGELYKDTSTGIRVTWEIQFV